MPKAKPDPNTGNLMLSVFDGTRQPIATGVQVLVRVRDGNQNEIVSKFFKKPNVLLQGLPFHNNFGDNYTARLWSVMWTPL